MKKILFMLLTITLFSCRKERGCSTEGFGCGDVLQFSLYIHKSKGLLSLSPRRYYNNDTVKFLTNHYYDTSKAYFNFINFGYQPLPNSSDTAKNYHYYYISFSIDELKDTSKLPTMLKLYMGEKCLYTFNDFNFSYEKFLKTHYTAIGGCKTEFYCVRLTKASHKFNGVERNDMKYIVID